ncbi:MAG: endonuclease/exonuclease/phosphatase family protein [Pseudohongiellaceae bacterium]
MTSLKVLTLNIHKGFSSGNLSFTLEKIRQQLRKTKSDLVFLQEVVGKNTKRQASIENWPDLQQFEYLADSLWPHFAYGKNSIYQHGHHGNAILSEVPFSTSNNIDISLVRYSQRGFLHGVLESGIHVLCTHLGLFETERVLQIRKLVTHIQESIPPSAPLILAGDFNDWNLKTHRFLVGKLGLKETYKSLHGRLPSTFPSRLPFLPMDRIYTRGFNVTGAQVLHGEPWHALTDHSPLTADISQTIAKPDKIGEC